MSISRGSAEPLALLDSYPKLHVSVSTDALCATESTLIVTPTAPERIWPVTLPTSPQEGWLQLAAILNLFSRCLLALEDRSSRAIVHRVIAVWCRALSTGHIVKGGIFNFDRGCQDTAAATRETVGGPRPTPKHGCGAYSYANAFAESVFASLKSELLPDTQPFTSKRIAALAILDLPETVYN